MTRSGAMPLACLLAAAELAGPGPAAAQTGVTFADVTAAAGITFTHNSGRAGKSYLPETMGPGGAFVDLDNDGWLDIVLVNGRDWAGGGGTSVHGLYKNNGDGTFTNVVAGSGLDTPVYGMGVTAGDYDNDGRVDLYITALEGDRLYHNEGGFKFRDVTKASGIANRDFGTSAAWLDYDKDGRLDLFVANYVKWSAEDDKFCTLDGTSKSYCTPEVYPGVASKLYRNAGNGRFEDVSEKAGVADPTSKSLGVAVLDFNADGWPDLFVANDTQPNKLYQNKGDGTFTDVGVISGVAYSQEGVARGAMGVDAGDYNGSGHPDVLVGNFTNQMLALYRNEGNGLFVDEAPRSTVGRTSMLSLAWAVFFFDYDLDGRLDIFSANGHLDETIGKVQPKVQYEQPPLMFRNTGNGRFESAGPALGADFNAPQTARGAAYGDYDRDGDLDLLIVNNDGPARLLRNDGGNRNHWIRIETVGTKSNRDGLGAIVRVQSPSGKQWRMVRSGSSYCSQSDTAITFGLGGDATVAAIEVEWPSGAKDRIENVKANQSLTITEGKGQTQ